MLQGQSAPVQVQITLNKPGTPLSFCLAVDVQGGFTVFAVGQALAERAVFGVALKNIDFVSNRGRTRTRLRFP